ncbi:MAG TPA: carboxypeptidase-like regulatory domain-containing protein, partial [Pyrinomonadaceae bacterium]
QGTVVDQNGSVVSAAKIVARNAAVSIERIVESDNRGHYQINSLAVGTYSIEVQAKGFKIKVVEQLEVQVGCTVVQDFSLEVGDINQIINVNSASPLVERATVSLGQVIDETTLQELPLNGRHFLDLGLLVPGSVTPPQSGFISAPLRGQGFFGLNTAGNREDTVNILVNGINLNDEVNNILTFQPPVSSLREFKVENSTLSAEYGRNSGAVVNVVSRSATNDWHGEVFEFFRNDVLDARNFFNFTTSKPPPFKRNQFGANIGVPIIKNRAYFFFAYEGLRQRQGVDLNSLVLSDVERTLPLDPIIKRLVEMIPRANFIDNSGSARFVGSASSKVTLNQWTLDIGYNLTSNDHLHAYYAYQGDHR